MKKPVIAIKLTPRSYAALVSLANRVIASLTGNVNYTTPAPTLVDFQTAVTDVENAIAKWGPKGNRGSHADLVDLRQKALILANMLKAEAQYVQNTATAAAPTDYPAMTAIITTSGYDLANAKTPQGVLQKVQGLHQFVSRKLNRNELKLKWRKPLNVTSKNNVKEYKVLRNTSTDLSTAVEVAIVTKGTFTDSNSTSAAVVWTYWVIPYNTEGPGVTSDPITVAVLSA